MSSFLLNGQRMMNAAVNTDPILAISHEEQKQLHYGLKERKIPHIKVTEMGELKAWFHFGDKIGQGSFGVVLEVIEKSTNVKWALKSVTKTTADGRNVKLVEREMQILKMIQHPHIIFLSRVFESPTKIFLIMERCYGELAKLYKERKPFEEAISRLLITQLGDAVAYLHKYDIVHRDLKMENILMGKNPNDPDDEYYIKLTDFGLSIMKCGKGIESMLHDFCGTLVYMAPEIITTRSYSQMCDVWAIGVILFMFITGKYPFFSKNEKELQEQICYKIPEYDSNQHPSPEVSDLILHLLDKEPANRMSASEMMHHPWILNRRLSKHLHRNILQMMKQWKPEMKVPTGKESDWVSPVEQTSSPDYSLTSRQQMILPKTNIQFARPKKISNDNHKVKNGGPSILTNRDERMGSPGNHRTGLIRFQRRQPVATNQIKWPNAQR